MRSSSVAAPVAPLIAPPAASGLLQVGTGFTQVFLQVLGIGGAHRITPVAMGERESAVPTWTDSNSIAGV
jgi:hypothetical protein